MKHNVGSYDVGVRFTVGCVALFLGVYHESWWGLLGLFPWATAVFGFCPLYAVLHVDTTAVDQLHPH